MIQILLIDESLIFQNIGYILYFFVASSEPPVIDFVYSAVEHYELDDMSPASWQEFNEKYVSFLFIDLDFVVYVKFYMYMYVGIASQGCCFKRPNIV